MFSLTVMMVTIQVALGASILEEHFQQELTFLEIVNLWRFKFTVPFSSQLQSLMKPSISHKKHDREDDEVSSEGSHAKHLKSETPLTLPVTPSKYDAPFPFYRRPAEVGRFSLDAQRCYHGDARQLRYYAPPPTEGPSPGFDLRDGYRDRYVRREESVHEGLEHLLRWVAQNQKQLQAEDKG